MSDYEGVKIDVFGSRKELKSYDTQDERQIAQAIREKVLPAMEAEYHSVRVKVKRKPDQKPAYLVAYMLRKDTYTADVVKIEVDGDYQVQNTVTNYDDSGEEEDEEGEERYSLGEEIEKEAEERGALRVKQEMEQISEDKVVMEKVKKNYSEVSVNPRSKPGKVLVMTREEQLEALKRGRDPEDYFRRKHGIKK